MAGKKAWVLVLGPLLSAFVWFIQIPIEDAILVFKPNDLKNKKSLSLKVLGRYSSENGNRNTREFLRFVVMAPMFHAIEFPRILRLVFLKVVKNKETKFNIKK